MEANRSIATRNDVFAIFRDTLLDVPVQCVSKDKALKAFFKVILAYRVLDVQTLLDGTEMRPPSTGGPLLENNHTPVEALNSLLEILGKFEKNLKHHLRRLHVEAKGEAISDDPSTRFAGPLMKMYSELASRVSKKGVQNTIINLTSVAIHLGCLLKGNVYLPPDIASIEQMLIDETSVSSDQEELARIHALHGGAGTYGCSSSMHHSLYLALLVSPIMLLLPREYATLSGKGSLLDLWRHIGGLDRPEIIVETDRALWKVIFAAAQGGDLLKDLSSTLQDLSTKVHEGVPAWIDVVSASPRKRKRDSEHSLSSNPVFKNTGFPTTPIMNPATGSTHIFTLDMEDVMNSRALSSSSRLPYGPFPADPFVIEPISNTGNIQLPTITYSPRFMPELARPEPDLLLGIDPPTHLNI
ncbi:hypothetical protein C0993_009739 [Termitomyces sp. T159_Od127]|nr:hypothetical protein C0993_009739 [Termitomyces sp. T159_Od127]